MSLLNPLPIGRAVARRRIPFLLARIPHDKLVYGCSLECLVTDEDLIAPADSLRPWGDRRLDSRYDHHDVYGRGMIQPVPSRKKSKGAANSAFQLKIQLLGIEPEIWRRVIVPSALTLQELHAVIQGAMGWQDYHLHMFEIDGKRFEVPEDERLGPEEGYEDERKWALKAILSKGMRFLYVYDFGDSWKHLVTVEDLVVPASDRHLPLCVAGERACPPEDCGGVYSYPDFLDALANPEHPQHRETIEWARGFAPEAFNITQANALIQAICALYRERHWGFGRDK